MTLRRLGKHLTLINVVISGTILLIIAFLALEATRGIIANQYANDLNVFTRWFLQASHEAINTEGDVQFQFQESYTIITVNDSNLARLMGEQELTEEELSDLLEQINRLFSQKLQSFFDRGLDPFMKSVSAENLLQIRVSGVARKVQDSIFYITPAEKLTYRIAYTMDDYLLLKWKQHQFRVSVTLIRSESPTLMLILQNRKDELRSSNQLRWMFVGCIVGGMLLIVFASMYISSRAIRPIEKSVKQQQAFVAAASHELRTPVAALRANAEVLRDAPLGDYTPYLESVLNVSERISLLISDLVDLARADVGELSIQKTIVDVAEVVEKAVLWMRPLAEKNEIVLTVSVAPLFIQADPDRLRQVLLVLLDNAIRYAPKGSHLDVAAIKKGTHAEITVSDDGVGIPDEHKAHVFERFYRLDQARSRENGGAGLGLSIAKQLVEQMDGSISLRDRVGGGACFCILFKLYKHNRQEGNS